MTETLGQVLREARDRSRMGTIKLAIIRAENALQGCNIRSAEWLNTIGHLRELHAEYRQLERSMRK